MVLQYIQTALECAHHEIIKDEEAFYGEVPLLAGVWATGINRLIIVWTCSIGLWYSYMHENERCSEVGS